MKHKNIAIFVANLGCKNLCSFCNQRAISNTLSPPTTSDVVNAVNVAVSKGESDFEIAFFGGSFTCLNRNYMVSLLEVAKSQVQKHGLLGIRISTRPDGINEEILDILKEYGVTSIELGAQSMVDSVLTANRRGHTSKDVVYASNLIKNYGFSLGLQMMTGLYKSDDALDLYTCERLIELMPDTIRIYPTCVVKNTELESLFLNGEYSPQTLEGAVSLCSQIAYKFLKNNITILRIGLHSEQSLNDNYVSGINHPAFGEMVYSRIFFNFFKDNLSESNSIISVHPKNLSKALGHKKENLEKLREIGYNIMVKADPNISSENFDFSITTVSENGV